MFVFTHIASCHLTSPMATIHIYIIFKILNLDINRDQDTTKQIKFRNYEPHADELRDDEAENDKSKRAKVAPAPTITEKVESEVAIIVSKALEETEVVNLVSKKPNWDLKRDVEAKLNKLNRSTQLAIARINKERMAQEEEEEEEEE